MDVRKHCWKTERKGLMVAPITTIETEQEGNALPFKFLLVWLGEGLLLTVGPILLEFCQFKKNNQTITWQTGGSADHDHWLSCPEVDAVHVEGLHWLAAQGRQSGHRPGTQSLRHICFHPNGLLHVPSWCPSYDRVPGN